MIYTSYFAQMRNFPKNVTPVAICQGVPSWYNGLVYKKIAPSWELINNKNHKQYTDAYKENVLGNTSVDEVVRDLQLLLGTDVPIQTSETHHVALLCYEKPEDFCHRHLVGAWLGANEFISEKKPKKKIGVYHF